MIQGTRLRGLVLACATRYAMPQRSSACHSTQPLESISLANAVSQIWKGVCHRNSTVHGVPRTSTPAASVQWHGPSATYSLLQECKSRTRQLVTSRFGTNSPLHKLVEDGTLVLYQRPQSYVERREDGYRCAELHADAEPPHSDG